MLMDFIFGKKEESNLNQRSQALNDLLLDELMKQYQQGPNPLPTYTAMAPDLAYSAPNTLLASLGMEQVARPDLPTTEIGGRTVYSSEALQKAMEEKFAAENPELYARLKREMNQRMNPAPAYHNTSYMERNTDRDDGDPLERHYSIFPDERPRTGPYADPNKPSGITYSGDYPTMGSMPAIRGYTTPDLGPVGNFVDDLKSAGRGIARDVGKIASSGGIIGSLFGGGR